MKEPTNYSYAKKTGDDDVGKRIALRREDLDMSRQELAAETGVSYSYISQIETGQRMPSYKQQIAIAQTLGVTLNDLFGDQDAAFTKPDTCASLPAARVTFNEAVEQAAQALEALPVARRLDAMSKLNLRITRGVVEDERKRGGGLQPAGWIEQLAPGEVFVFGSNPKGVHAGGASRQAFEKFGATWGQASGLSGQSYAIISGGGLKTLAAEAKKFIKFAKAHSELRFLLTPVGTGLAGNRVDEVAPFFADVPDNVVMPAEFLDALAEN